MYEKDERGDETGWCMKRMSRVVNEKDEQGDETGWCMKRMSRVMRRGGV